ncbi:B12-binding domain-containing radical SAM protein [Sinorhizobium meliloti]|uniref:B12-binding domain-containing radical SAM protein n=1 Tax=Rhizobium meliloti TaxID=382 RepID=UPI000FDBA1B7|nr:radical SAM protein [Sinorhizobium meliloti]RVQ56046.1 radical SAM protein [Sinorhizobium meliloti]
MTGTMTPPNGPVLLCLLPFWSPLAPPLGIAILKGHLQDRGFHAEIEDFNSDPELWSTLSSYVDILRRSIPEVYHSNLFDFAYDVIHNHIMAHIHHTDQRAYEELVGVLVQTSFVVPPARSAVLELINCVEHFLDQLVSKVLEAIEQHAPTCLGVSTYTTTLGATLAALRAVRAAYPHIRTVLGGGVFADHLAPGSQNFDAIARATEPYLDAIVVGEGELIFERLLSGTLPPARVHSSAEIDRKVVDLNNPAIPDFGGLDLSVYPQMATYVGRSCPFQCSFCSETVQWGKYRSKQADFFISELAYLTSRYGGKAFLLTDSLINPVADQVFRATARASTDLYFDAYLRADPEVCDAARVSRWRDGGFYRARLGVESGSSDVLSAMNKQTGPSQIRTAIRTLANSGIKTTTYWVIGHPRETEEDFQASLAIIEDCADDIYEAEAHTFYYFPRGQVSSKKWAHDFGVVDLYGEKYAHMLVARTWQLNQSPSRAEMLDRMSRFTTFCRQRGIPNPYSLAEIEQADTRWNASHPAAGPALVELHNLYHPPTRAAAP